MRFPRKYYFQRQSRPKGPRANDRIRALEVQVINNDGKNLGVVPIREAIELAKGQGLEVSTAEALFDVLNANPDDLLASEEE